MSTLQQEPLLPLTKKQRLMIGEERAAEAVRAQLAGRGLHEMPLSAGGFSQASFITSAVHANASVDVAGWAVNIAKALAASTRRTGNHVCRPDVCHKGRIGKTGFCRMYFWHWRRYVNDKGVACAKRAHGMTLAPRWDGASDMPPLHTVPPFQGAPALEICHPFHYKMTLGVSLGPMCNHDVGNLLRMWKPGSETVDRGAAVSGMLDVMGDTEFYCASYSSKDQPHAQGLLTTLADDIAAKENRLMSSTNRRMDKGYQDSQQK